MAVITEASIRGQYKGTEEKVYYHQKNDILTPSARQYLSDQGVKIVTEKDKQAAEAAQVKEAASTQQAEVKTITEAPSYAYVCYETGAHFIKKPEHMTQLTGNQLVAKNHKRIVLRGQIDLLLAKVIEQLQYYRKSGQDEVAKDLRELFDWVKAIQRAEILEEPIPSLTFMGYDEATQKAMSHDPKRYFGTPHLFGIDENTHEVAVAMNILRAQARSIELTAVDAFYRPKEVQRPDLLLAFNRLSSCIYLIMLKAVSGKYDPQSKK